MTNDREKQPPLCFVLMPSGVVADTDGQTINFDQVYQAVVGPAVEHAGMEPIRADVSDAGGGQLEQLMLCDFAVVDLSVASAGTWYQVGLRQGIREETTIPIFASGTPPSFDIDPWRSVEYAVTDGAATKSDSDIKNLAAALTAAKEKAVVGPVFRYVTDLPEAGIKHLKTDLFRKRVGYAKDIKEHLAIARADGRAAVDAVGQRLGPVDALPAAVAVDLLLSYRAVGAWDAMIDLVAAMPDPVRRCVLVQEQLGLALNRADRGLEAEQVLLDLIDRNGPSSETCAILGRVYTDRWDNNRKDGGVADDVLEQAIAAYRLGFETDWRDAYPGINAVRLMELADPPDPAAADLRPVVHYAAVRRIAGGEPNYWDHATLLELAVLDNDADAARAHAADALAAIEEQWQPETTVRNLRWVYQARRSRGADVGWMKSLIDAFEAGGAP